MARTKRYAISLTSEQLDLLDDILAYYRLSGFGGGDHSDAANQDLFVRMERQVTLRRQRAAGAAA